MFPRLLAIRYLSHRRTSGRVEFPTPCLSLWRFTLRRFPLVSSRTASPRPVPSRRQVAPPSAPRHRGEDDKNHTRPQGLAPLPSPWRHPVLPPGLARSSLGLAFQIEPDPGANRRPGRPAGHARRRSPRPRHRTGGGNPHPTTHRRHRSTRWEARTPDPQVRIRPANKRGSASWTGRNPRARFRGWTRSTRVASAFKGQGGVSFVCTAAHPGHSSGPAEATTCPAWGSQPDPGARQTEAWALRLPCTAEAAPQPKPRGWHALPPRRASPLRFPNDRDRRDDLGHAPFRQRWLRFRVAETRHAADPVLESGER